ncbi:hypothetical protein EHI8A_114200 [Entamoeba histolytica HM-1:IMSS-B]|uniref:Uncharacterized protein n=6 Tax=Entamoeba histolytica TaxID=5759 RepID=C4M2T4_ENTH1|nr:hypothetical protein EHI_077250 [Entamoeba histolytica HM-1:IMSS]EMD43752.1 Hypothetical protein EHI5A_011700 [Entamoeba histolytica KU27]EMH73734.1 hypothetical protein EHI8A_114200 [Entamoeba histolytica HM-1:IMSS-B]ENY61749.1 hypothetical protein EHI7A_077390 [Entamoeba histolytica HM-1:IMSS-A]GAT95604.1 hypothetical protein CL6EHI_077250 [Entamoeba histolytica]EAL49548.1 hypothetical protein EHI_077250 [Entamoeba histolytica HM-1:IMSS]|eukprot:XP_654934.1 hypothetical protein EHI_077250 [Entamoeba histolytica HM-1:IMSS]
MNRILKMNNNERSSLDTNKQELKEIILREIKIRTKLLQSNQRYNGMKCEGYCSVLIGDEVPGKFTVSTFPPPIEDEFFSIENLLKIIERFEEDAEIINAVMYCIAIMVLEITNRSKFKRSNGIEIIKKIIRRYEYNLTVLRCCCSILANVGPYIIDLECIKEIERIIKIHPYDQFIQTALCATYANYARINPRIIVENGIIEKMKPMLCEINNTDLQYSVLAAYSNISRNCTIGQKKCIENKIHEIIINKLVNEKCTTQYWRVSCNTLGCLAINGLGYESNEVVKYAQRKGLIDKIIEILHIIEHKEIQDKRFERMYGCLAKFALVQPIKRIPKLIWICYQQCLKKELLPNPLNEIFHNDSFKCHICKKICDPMMIRSIKFQEKLILMSYCSIKCWKKRHEN